jgi:hypothetical protein
MLPRDAFTVAQVIALLEAEAIKRGAPPDCLKAYDANRYRRDVFGAASAFWKEGNRGNFYTRMNALIKFGLKDAWEAGAKAVGVLPDEFEPEDTEVINGIIAEEKSHVAGLLDFLDGLANDPKAKLSDADYRLEMWANRWPDVYNRALAYWGGKAKLVWVLGGTVEHCSTCSRLAGIVAWASEWASVPEARPQSHSLECNGFRCRCRMEPTTRRRSPRALARIREIVGV